MTHHNTTKTTCQHSLSTPITSGFESAEVRWSLPFRLAQHYHREQAEQRTTTPDKQHKLVTPCKTQETTFELYPRTVKVKRPFNKEQTPPPPRNMTAITGFSDSSRRNLRFKAVNSSHLLKSQFGLSYGQHAPTDGRICKSHFNRLREKLTREFPFFQYLWIAEFQSRGALHFHLFTNIQPTDANREIIANAWCNIVNAPDKANMLKVHDNPKNFIKWDMGNGSYLCKYLDKEAQKSIPEEFTSFGRYWGASTNLIDTPETITAAELHKQLPDTDTTTGETHEQDPVKFLLRTIGRYHEKHHRRSWFRNTNKSTSAITGAPIYRQTLNYLKKSRSIPINLEPF